MDLPESCKGVLPEDYFFLNECEARCFCESKSYDEYLECINSCYRGVLAEEPMVD